MFFSYEMTKLFVPHPDIINYLILVIFAAVSLIFIEKNSEPIKWMERRQTEQIRGLAILFVIIGHLWVHVASVQPALVLSNDAVGVFYLLSGYGLMKSSSNKNRIAGKVFAQKRIRRVFLPYWVVSVFLILLDYVILNRIYSAKDICMTLAGINTNLTTKHIDYVRWYITLLLVWYVLFYLVSAIVSRSRQLICLIGVGLLIFFLDYYITGFGWKQVLAFPIGCFLAIYDETIYRFFSKHINGVFGCGLALLSGFIIYKISVLDWIHSIVPGVIYKGVNESASLIFGMALIIMFAFMGHKRLYSRFLMFCGGISYELFLLHGAFLIKYNPVIKNPGQQFIIPLFFIYLLVVMGLSLVCKKFIGKIDGWIFR